ncbi:hypothetical protein QZH41_005695 [Actinostola sp. cb2023]|nr:hypothetical protein QZH41_005695 [Actinostola sp. cb2023]
MAVSMVCGNFTRFTKAKDDPNLGSKFTDWLAKFENELIAWGVDDERQRKAGDVAWEKWLTCTTEEKGNDKAYDSAKKTLSDYFDKKRDPDFEVTKFRECVQKPEQSIDSYVTQLRSLARYCDFGNRADDEIKLQIKLNCASSRLRRKAFAEPQWKLDDLVKYARALEIFNKQASEIEHIPTNVNAVKFVRPRQQGAARAPATRNRQPRDRQAPMNKSKNNTCGNCGYEYPHQELIQVSNNINYLPTADHPNTGKLIQRYPELFEDKIGQLKDYEVKLHIDPDVKPVAQPHRRVPFHLRAKVEEINQLLDADVIEKVEGPTPWVSPIVVTPKANAPDKIRMCVDMRAANTVIERERYITPTVDDIIGQIHGSSVFSKLDLRSGYHQLTLAPESRYITTFATHTRLYRYKRLSFGINAATEVFQHPISQLLADIPGALNISDDVIVFGQTQNDHDETLEKTLKKFSDNHITLNAKKCEFNKTSLEFFGFVFSDGGMKPDPKKVEDIQNLEPPTNVKELRSVLGMTGYSSRFIQDYATITAPLRELTHKNSSWNWTTTHQEAFETLKEKLQSAPALAYFDISKSTEIAVDASPVGLGAILTQKDENGHSHVIAYGSRSLTKTEQNYSQTEREVLAIVWGCEHYHLYCYGKALTVFTDHKPLTSTFNNPLSKPTPRIERWSLRLQPYQPNIVYAPGPDNPADYISRHPKKQREVNSREKKIAEEYINFVSQHAVPIAIDLEEVKSATLNDHTLQRVIECIRNGSWYKKDAQDLRVDNRAFNSYQMVKDELSVNAEGNLVLRGTKIVMPDSLQNRSVDIAHEGHQGMVKTKALIREKVWFPFIDTLIEDKINSCLACQSTTKRNIREPLQMSKLPDGPWLEISADLFGPLPSGQHLLVVIDDYSRFPEVEIVHSTSADAVVPHLDNIISRHQIPIKIRTDNGPPFNSESFAQYTRHMGIKHRKITPLWPEANASDGKHNITRNSSKFKPLKTNVQPINQELMDEHDDIGIEEEPSDDIIEPNASGQGQMRPHMLYGLAANRTDPYHLASFEE